MNKNLKVALKNCSSEQGFAIPIAIGLGLIMILIGSTMVVRSQGDQVTASAQKATADSLGVAETGVTRVQSLLKRFPKMAQSAKSDWSSEYTRLSTINTCLGSTQDSNLVTNINAWQSVDSSNSNKGEFKVLAYTYTGNVGTLKIAGRARSENGSTNASADNATNYLEVEIPVVPLSDFPIPGLWAKNLSMGNNDVSGNILVAACTPAGVSTANIVPNSGSLNANPSIEYPPLPSMPASGVNTLSAVEAPKTLPEAENIQGADGVYRYLVGKNGSGRSIELSGSQTLTITSGQKVTLYLQGDINMVGTSKIIHTGTPTNFQVYGSDGGTKYRIATDTNTYTTANVTISGNAEASMFIYAPNATVSINGTASIRGSVWANTWSGSKADQLVVTQLANWVGLPLEQPKRIGSVQSWQRQQASN